jgi:hypothetical protein
MLENSLSQEKMDDSIKGSKNSEENWGLNSLNIEMKKEIVLKYQNPVIDKKIKLYAYLLQSISMFIDGYLIIFIAFNSKQEKHTWTETQKYILILSYHLITAFGGVFAVFTSFRSNKVSLSLSNPLLVLSFCFLFVLITVQNYYSYLVSFFLLCFTNGHLMNTCSNYVIKKFQAKTRACAHISLFSFNQIGQLIFSLITYGLEKTEQMVYQNTTITIIPLFFLIIIQFLFNNSLIYFLYFRTKEKEKTNKVKKKLLLKDKSINFNDNIMNVKNSIEIRLRKDMAEMLIKPFRMIFVSTKFKYHAFLMVFLNISIGLQFFSMINVFPSEISRHIKSSQNDALGLIVEWRIIYSFLLILIAVMSFSQILERKKCLFIIFFINFILSVILVLDFTQTINTPIILNLFRFLWNLSYVITNLYCAEAVSSRLRTMFTSILTLLFKFSCILELGIINQVISIHNSFPLIFNVFILLSQIYMSLRLPLETHHKPVDQINNELIFIK